jgi:hypothetical protein
LRKLLAVAVLALLATSSNALTITATDVTVTAADVGQSFTVDYDGFVNGGSVINGLTSSAVMSVVAVSSTSITLSVAITNTSSSPITGSRVSVFGFDTNPNVVSAAASGFFSGTVVKSGLQLPSGFGSIEMCVKNGQTNNCSGGGGTGIAMGASGTTTLTLNFSSIGASGVTFSNFGVRYQSLSGAGNVTSAVGRGTPTPPIPEPTSMAVFGLGALIVGAALRGRANA